MGRHLGPTTPRSSSFLAFLRMSLSEGGVEGVLASGDVGPHFAAGCGPYAFHCGLANTASGLIGVPQLCVVGLLGLLVAVVAPMVVAHLIFRHEEKWKIIPWTYLLPAFCNGQGFRICRPHEDKI